MRYSLLVLLVLALLVSVVGCGNGGDDGQTISVGGAASLEDVLTDIAADYQTATGVHVRLVFASSGKIAQQQRGGAGFDAVALASSAVTDRLADDGELAVATRRDVATNRLVLVTPTDQIELTQIAQIADVGLCERLSIGEPETVPAGSYALEALRNLGLWDTLGDRLVFGANVRQVLSYAERGEVDAGVVYATDAALGNVRTVAEFPESSHTPVIYPAAVTADAAEPELAAAFVDYLASDSAREAFARYGFSTPAEAE